MDEQSKEIIDRRLDAILKKMNAATALKAQKDPEIKNIEGLLAPALKYSVLSVYHPTKRSIVRNYVYQGYSPPIKRMQADQKDQIDKNELQEREIDPDRELLILNARGAGVLNSREMQTNVATIDIRFTYELSENLDLEIINMGNGNKEKLYSLTFNYYRISGDVQKGVYFLSTNDKNTEGYLIVSEETVFNSQPLSTELAKFLNNAGRPNSPEETNVVRAYKVTNNGQVRTKIDTNSEFYRATGPIFGRIIGGVFRTDADYKLNSFKVFLNGYPVKLEDLLEDMIDAAVITGKAHLGRVKPKIVNGKVEYTCEDGKISRDLPEFLEEIKIFYGSDINLAKQVFGYYNNFGNTKDSPMYG